MNEVLLNKVHQYWDEYYLTDKDFEKFRQLFTEDEIFKIYIASREESDRFCSSLVAEIRRAKFSFNSEIVFNKIMAVIDSGDTNFYSSGLYELVRGLNSKHAYLLIKKCYSFKYYEDYSYLVDGAIEALDSDMYKEKIVREKIINKDDSHRVLDIVQSIKDDTIKARCLKYVNKYDRPYVISDFESDYFKVKYLTVFAKNKGSLIKTLKDDKLKEKYLRKYWHMISSEDKGDIIASFENDELVYKYLGKVSSEKSKVPIIRTLIYRGNREKALEMLNKMSNSACIADALWYFGCKDDVLPYALRLRNDEQILNVLRGFDDNSNKKFLEMLKHCSSRSIFNEYDDNLSGGDKWSFVKIGYIKNFKLLERLIDHVESFPEFDDDFLQLVGRYAEEYKVNKERLLFLVKNLGLCLLRYVKSVNVQKILNLDEAEFNKVLQIIDVENLKMNSASYNDSVNALLQRKFRVKVPEIVMIFPTALQAIEEGNKKELGEMLDVLSSHLGEEVYDEIFANKEIFVNALISKNDIAIEKLHTLTSKYIKLKRNEYVRNEVEDTKKETLIKVPEKKKAIKALIANYPIGYIVHLLMENYYHGNLTDEESTFLEDKERLVNVIKYKKNPQENKELLNLVKGDFKLLDSVCEKRFGGYGLDHMVEGMGVPYEYKFYEPNTDMLLSFLAELDVDKMKMGVLNDDELFNYMMSQIKQYSFLGWIGGLDRLAFDSGISVDPGLIANFINYYPAIYNELKERMDKGMIPNMTFTSFLDFAACFDSGSKRYSLLFGSDNYGLIASNPQPNSSSSSKDERIKEALKYYKVIKHRKKVSVPPVDKDFEVGGKKININVGNFSNPINLTYGERTGACMRVLGAGDTLFDFCLKDDNGFHIRFSDSSSGEFVSRVSGFRNGNTVFLNQLRHSVSGKYTNQDIVSACEQIAQYMIDVTRNSDSPIDNVVISRGYSMSESRKRTIDLGVRNIKQGLSNTTFYSDVGESAILLASSDANGELVPLKLGNGNNKVRYDVLRDKPRMYLENDGIDKMLQMEVGDQYLSGVDIGDFKVREIEELLFCYVGEDWYISVDKNKKIETFIMKNSANIKAAELEIEEISAIIESKINLIDADSMKM